MFGYFDYSHRSKKTEPDYMDVLKPHFEVQSVNKNSKHSHIFDMDAEDANATFSLPEQQNTTQQPSTTEVDTKICVECDTPSILFCPECEDAFCEICYGVNHRSGRRTLHKPIYFSKEAGEVKKDSHAKAPTTKYMEDTGDLPAWWSSNGVALSGDWFLERSRYIPLRLTHEERKFLRLLQGVLKVSTYVNKVDLPDSKFKNKAGRKLKSIQEISAIFTALITASNYQVGIDTLASNDICSNALFLQNVLELGRRHKIRNPEKMRTSYGTLMSFLQDATSPESQEMLGFNCVRPVRTVYELLEKADGLDLLRDPLVATATQEIMSHTLPQPQVQALIKQKEQALKELQRRYTTDRLSAQTILLAVYSIGDNHNFLRMNRDPCNELLHYLATYFDPETFSSEDHCLAIQDGEHGARLSHSHSTQYHYVLQSLSLWRDILDDFFRLWIKAEEDLLDVTKNPYILKDTGQGLNRLQQSPRTDRGMREIVSKAQKRAGAWIGSSVIHLGDDNVPNALFFIDKYNQVGRILGPIVVCLRGIEKLLKNERTTRYIMGTYGSVEGAKRAILLDLFKRGFDGSGGDNFMDQGSCIDGRMTSLGQWRTDIATKPFYPLFQLTGAVEMDGVDWDN